MYVLSKISLISSLAVLRSVKTKVNVLLGTQGGTFARQRENPFSRARRSQTRQDTSNSSSSSDSEDEIPTPDAELSRSAGEPSTGSVFMVLNAHSINGKTFFLFPLTLSLYYKYDYD